MKTVTICGSMRFEKQMRRIALDLETKCNMNVLQCTYSTEEFLLSEEDVQAITRAHYRKIDLSDGSYVVDIDGYIGNAVQQEITYAKETGKAVIFHSRFR